MATRIRFDSRQRAAVERALERAEALTGDFYRIPGREWTRLPYDVGTLRDGPGPDGRVFADVVRLVRRAPGHAIRGLFRIRLRDDAILAAVEDRGDGIGLDPLLLYVLTHELVHVVRFGCGLAGFDAGRDERDFEERRVHAITREVLRPIPDPRLRRVVEVYRDGAPPSLGGLSPK